MALERAQDHSRDKTFLAVAEKKLVCPADLLVSWDGSKADNKTLKCASS